MKNIDFNTSLDDIIKYRNKPPPTLTTRSSRSSYKDSQLPRRNKTTVDLRSRISKPPPRDLRTRLSSSTTIPRYSDPKKADLRSRISGATVTSLSVASLPNRQKKELNESFTPTAHSSIIISKPVGSHGTRQISSNSYNNDSYINGNNNIINHENIKTDIDPSTIVITKPIPVSSSSLPPTRLLNKDSSSSPISIANTTLRHQHNNESNTYTKNNHHDHPSLSSQQQQYYSLPQLARTSTIEMEQKQLESMEQHLQRQLQQKYLEHQQHQQREMQLQLEKLQRHIEQLSQIQQQQQLHTYQINNQGGSFSNHSLINTISSSGNDGNTLPLHHPSTHHQHNHQQQRSGVVILSNLDQQATPHDVQIVCSRFGFVTRCDMMYDSQGRSCGEAEIEFADINAACEFVQQFDKQTVDNRVVSAVLRQDRVQPSVKSVITPTRSGYRTKGNGKEPDSLRYIGK